MTKCIKCGSEYVNPNESLYCDYIEGDKYYSFYCCEDCGAEFLDLYEVKKIDTFYIVRVRKADIANFMNDVLPKRQVNIIREFDVYIVGLIDEADYKAALEWLKNNR